MPYNESIKITEVQKSKLQVIRQLALDIWPATYSAIQPQEQIDYMLELFYSEQALSRDFDKPGYHFFIINVDDIDVGYAGVEAKENNTWHLHKIYLSQKLHGKGLGKALIGHVENFAKEHGASHLTLNVNRLIFTKHVAITS